MLTRVNGGCFTGVFFAALVIVLFANFCGGPIIANSGKTQLHGVVVDAYNKQSSGNDYFYAAIIPDGAAEPEVFQNVDQWLQGKTNSADVQQRLKMAKDNKTPVTVTVVGVRWTLFSWFRNITEVKPDQTPQRSSGPGG